MQPRVSLSFVLLALGLALLALLTLPSLADAQKPLPPNDRAKGLIYDGLELPTTEDCKGGFRVKVSGKGVNRVQCSPGPDEVPPTLQLAKSVPPIVESTGGGTTVCDGDGVSGKRTQVLYAHAADIPSRYATYLTSFQQWAADADAEFENGAAQTNGTRHLRFVTDGSCRPVVQQVQLSTAGDDNFGNMLTELMTQGYNRTDRNYLIFMDAPVYCGIASIRRDDQPGQGNQNNVGPNYARVDSGCWGGMIAAHELTHNLGGVQMTAPHADGNWHCNDGYDNMCNHSGHATQIVCPDPMGGQRLDCNHDDYYNAAPAAGSYLATHWNPAYSGFLIIPASLRADEFATGVPKGKSFAPQSDFRQGSKVAVRTHLVDQVGANLPGVSVKIEVRRPDGAVQCALVETTDAAGAATGTCAISRKEPPGTWTATVTSLSKAGYTADYANSVTSATFLVR